MKPVLMEGLSNTFVVLQGSDELSPDAVSELCAEYHTDGLLCVSPLDEQTVKMSYWNADGSKAEMCGNGLLCVTRFAVDNHMVAPGEFSVVTDAGLRKVKWDGTDENEVEVQVGKVLVEDNTVEIDGRTYYLATVGNPHAITFVDDVATAPVVTVGPAIECDSYFPNKTNVEFVTVGSGNEITMRVWERGVGETQACGTGMVSVAAVAEKNGFVKLPMTMHVPGGSAKIWRDEEGFSHMLAHAEYLRP